MPDSLFGLLVGLETESRLSALDALGKRLFQRMPAALRDSLGLAFVAWVNRIVAARWGTEDNPPRIEAFREVAMLETKVEGWGARYRRQGEKAGEARGEAKGKVELLERLLIRRFSEPLPSWVRHRLLAASVDQLNTWVDGIFDAPTLEALLGKP